MGSDIMVDKDFISEKGLLKFIFTVWPFLFQFDWPTFGRLRVKDVKVSRTGHGYHVIIRVSNDIAPLQLIQLQVMLGSDVRRENHNLVRVNCTGIRPWNLLYDWKFMYYWKHRGRRKNEFVTLSRERRSVRLSKQIRRLIRKFQRRKARVRRKP